MKDKFTITISDVHGVRQFTLHQFIKIVAKWVVLAVALLFTIGILLLHTFSSENEALSQKTARLEAKQAKLEATNEKLKEEIAQKSDLLASINKQLAELESAIGIAPDMNASYLDRVRETREQALRKIEEEKKNAVAAYEKARLEKLAKLIKQKLTTAQITLLNNSIPSMPPLRKIRVTSYYGERTHPITKRREFHFGIDLAAPTGTPVYAPADGVVTFAQKKNGYGNFLLLDHFYGFKTAYGHLNGFAVHEGQYVKKGDLIAYTGNSGRSTGPHLHYEIRYLNKWINPRPFLSDSPASIHAIVARSSVVEWSGLIDLIKRRVKMQTIQ